MYVAHTEDDAVELSNRDGFSLALKATRERSTGQSRNRLLSRRSESADSTLDGTLVASRIKRMRF
jgi:hypothetical protein